MSILDPEVQANLNVIFGDNQIIYIHVYIYVPSSYQSRCSVANFSFRRKLQVQKNHVLHTLHVVTHTYS